MTDDAQCLRQYAESRDQAAFSEFVRRNVNLVYSAAYRQTGGDSHLAEDISQKVFVAAARKAAVLGRHPVVGAWLFQTTRYEAIDAIRSRQRREARELAASQMNETLATLEASPEWDQISPALDQVVASLGEEDRNAVVLRFFGQKSFAEIGSQLELSEGAARMRVERALEKLRRRLARKGITSSCAALGALLSEKSVMAAPAGTGAAAIETALAVPVAGGVVVTLGILKIMTTTKLALGVVTVIALAGIAAAVHEHQHAVMAEQALADAVRARPVARRQAPPANSAPATAGASANRPAQNGGPGPAAGASHRGCAAQLPMLTTPAMQRPREITSKVRLDGQYAALFTALNLPPVQVDQFKNLLVEKEMVGFDSMAAAKEQGIDPKTDPRGFFMAVMSAEKTVDTQISSLLGTDGFSQFQQYQQTVPARNTTNLLTQALSYTATPLTDAQNASVVQALTQYGAPALPPSNPFASLNGDLGIVTLSEQGLAQIQGILSPPQVAALQEKIQQQQLLLQARQQVGAP